VIAENTLVPVVEKQLALVVEKFQATIVESGRALVQTAPLQHVKLVGGWKLVNEYQSMNSFTDCNFEFNTDSRFHENAK
jgi:hypothetical protein